MRLSNLILILLVILALSGYSAWAIKQRPVSVAPQATEDVAGIPLLRRAAAESLWRDPSTLFVDVRSRIDYEFGHIAGALSLPEEEFEQRFPELRSRLTWAGTIIVYCGSRDCGKSLWATIRLRKGA
jgi:predicted sulfurtransferase